MTEPTGNPSPIDYRNPIHAAAGKPQMTVRKVIGWTVGAIFMVLLLIACLLPSLGRARETANRVKCQSNLRQIGQAILLYANDNRGQMPPDLATVLETQDVTSEVFYCPSSDHTKATGPTTQQVITMMLSGDHLSYAYVGVGNIFAQTSDDIVAFEVEAHIPKDAERTTGINVLLGDGSTKFVDEKVAKAIRARFNAGVRPIRLSDCDPTLKATTKPTLGP